MPWDTHSNQTRWGNLRFAMSCLTDTRLAIGDQVIASTLMRMRDRPVNGVPTPRRKPSAELRKLLQAPHLQSWLQSDDFLRAPKYWPVPCYAAFPPHILVTPYELGAARPHARFMQLRSDGRWDYALIQAYCRGASIDLLSHCTDICEEVLLLRMARTLRDLFLQSPGHYVWACNVDWQRATLIEEMWPTGAWDRDQLRKALIVSPISVPPDHIREWVDNDRYRAILLHSTPKAPRLCITTDPWITGGRRG